MSVDTQRIRLTEQDASGRRQPPSAVAGSPTAGRASGRAHHRARSVQFDPTANRPFH